MKRWWVLKLYKVVCLGSQAEYCMLPHCLVWKCICPRCRHLHWQDQGEYTREGQFFHWKPWDMKYYNKTLLDIFIFITFLHLALHCHLGLSSLHLWEWSCRHRTVILSIALAKKFQFEGRLFCYPHAWFCSIHSCSTLVSVLQHQFELILGHHLCENLFPSLLGPVSMNNLYFDWYQTINGLSRSGIIE